MKFTTRRSAALAALATTAALALAGCSSGDDGGSGGGDTGGGGEDVSVVMLPKNLGNPYFDTSTKGAKAATEEFGGTFSEVGPDTASPDAQVSFINTAAQQGTQARIVSANDPKAICDALDEARAAGTKVVTFDSDTDPACRDLFINQASSEGIAKVQVDLIAEQIGGSGQIAILSASANATNQNAWIELMEEELAASHPDIELVEVVYGDD
ncbi:MAG: substrate-binding domain-containing protein, partial [Pseudonocardia sp.]